MNKTEEIQKKVLAIYKVIKEICDRHNLRYYAIGGTAIGAVRHKGFIPWDDDLDIAMPWEDYRKFFSIAEKELPENLRIRVAKNIEPFWNFFDKIHNIETTFIEQSELFYPQCYKGIFVDIMPLFGISGKAREQKKIIKRTLFFLSANARQWRNPRECSTKGKLLCAAAKVVQRIKHSDFWYRQWVKSLSKNDFDKSDCTGYTWSRSLSPRLIFDRTWFDDYVELPFEDTTMRMPIGYHEMLTRQFGNYMQLPPENERVNHDGGIIDTERPYSFYQEEFRKKGTLKEYLK